MSRRQPPRKLSSKKQKISKKRLALKKTKQKTVSSSPKVPSVKIISSGKLNKQSPVQNKSFEKPVTDLPFSYNETKLCMLVRDPYWAYTYWDFSAQTWDWIENLKAQTKVQPILRIRNMDNQQHHDIKVDLNAKNWYIHLGMPNTGFEADLGLLESNGSFHLIAKSNTIRTPRNEPSNTIDKDWDAEDFDEIYRLSGGRNTGHGSETFHTPKNN